MVIASWQGDTDRAEHEFNPESKIRIPKCAARGGMAAICTVIAWGIAAASAAAQPVVGQITAVGLRCRSQSNFAVRPGTWTPLLCDLKLQINDHFEGELVCEQTDLDGDIITSRQPIVLSADKRVWLYVPCRPSEPSKWQVYIADNRGTRINALDVAPVDQLGLETFILDISVRPAPMILSLHSSGAFSGELGMNRDFYRPVAVGAMPAGELPDRWWGLEAANVVVWDQPDPDKLSPAQTDALLQWVRNGGQLVLGIGPAWRRIQKTALAELLPYDANATTVATDSLPEFAARYKIASPDGGKFKTPIEVVVGRTVRGQRVMWDAAPDGRRFDLVVAMPLGSGRVMAVAAGLADLLGEGTRREFCGQILDLHPMEASWLKKEAEAFVISGNPIPVARELTKGIEFAGLGQLLRIAAVLFVGAYILIAVFATWIWLGKKSMTHLSWSVFALCAIAASGLSLAAVNFTGGFSARVNSVSMVDFDLGAAQGGGPCWFGYRSPVRRTLNFLLDGDGSYLRPFTGERAPLTYATPQRYEAYAVAIPPDQPHLKNVLMRASLKQFEGHWHGPLDGTIRGQVTIDRATGRLSRDTWLKNDLAVDITRAWLLYVDPRLRDTRVAGVTMNWAGSKDRRTPADNVLVTSIAPLRVGERLNDPGRDDYKALDDRIAQWAARGSPAKESPDVTTLRERQLGWAGGGGTFGLGGGDSMSAALLASTQNFYLHMNRELDAMGRPLSTVNMPNCDVSSWLLTDQLSAGQAVLLAESAEPGPASLFVNGQAMKASAGMTLYRVRVPVTLTGAPPPAPGAAATPARPDEDVDKAIKDIKGGNP